MVLVPNPAVDHCLHLLLVTASRLQRLWNSTRLKTPGCGVDSASQNAFDTGAAMGLIVPYATYMTRKNGVVRFSMFIPTMNNFVSLLCALTIFSTVFSTLIQTQSTLSRTGIVEIIKQSGPASTGLTFIWIPVLFGQFDVFGSILCVLFFLCLSFAGVSSLIANIELTSLTPAGLWQ
uniref:AA_permease domain-containing protein n=1 Tax=Macrostomum lignano TaxID=282301 RepID=A0A1I8HEX3_9PLAT